MRLSKATPRRFAAFFRGLGRGGSIREQGFQGLAVFKVRAKGFRNFTVLVVCRVWAQGELRDSMPREPDTFRDLPVTSRRVLASYSQILLLGFFRASCSLVSLEFCPPTSFQNLVNASPPQKKTTTKPQTCYLNPQPPQTLNPKQPGTLEGGGGLNPKPGALAQVAHTPVFKFGEPERRKPQEVMGLRV